MKCRFLRFRPPPLSARKKKSRPEKTSASKKIALRKKSPAKKIAPKKLHLPLDILFLRAIIVTVTRRQKYEKPFNTEHQVHLH